jgi:signal transduction histidine kinase
VTDDGAGLSAASHEGQGMGMRIMNYRASKIGGSLKFRSGNGAGTCVECSLPAGGLVDTSEENS